MHYDIHTAEIEIKALKDELEQLKIELVKCTEKTDLNTKDILILSMKMDNIESKIDNLERAIMPNLLDIKQNTAKLKSMQDIFWRVATPVLVLVVGGVGTMFAYVLKLMFLQ